MGQFDRGFDVDATEHAISPNVGIDDGFDTKIFKLFAQINHIVAGKFAPTVGGDFAIACIQAHNDVPTKRSASVLQKAGIAHRRSTNDDVAQACIQIALNGVQIADTATQLHIHFVAHFAQNFANRGFVFGVACKSTVEIDQVQAPRTFVNPTSCHDGGVLAKRGGLRHIALFQANTVTVF